jgi:hypothetical protein
MKPDELARSYAGGRVAIGLLLFLFPRRVMRGLWGESPAVTFLTRLVGVRDALLGAGALAALQSNTPGAARPWMTYGAVADSADAVATLLAFRHLPRLQRLGLLAMAASGAGAGVYLMSALDEPAA